jgi:serine/threonine protein kinase
MSQIDQAAAGFALARHHYQLLDKIGHGAFGAVYRVHSTKFPDAKYVAKLVTLSDASDADKLVRFHREIDIHKSLDHPNILRIFDCFDEDGVCAIVLEFCEHGRIDEYVARHRVSASGMSDLFRQILEALAHCHSHGIAHRDIKPANILIDQYGRPKLSDFGISCLANEQAHGTAGTYCYMAPEVITGKRHDIDLYRADVWSLAVTFYMIACGRPPWPDDIGLMEMEMAVVAGIGLFPIEISPALRRLIKAMTAEIPDDRPLPQDLLLDPYFEKVPTEKLIPLERKAATLVRLTAKIAPQRGKIRAPIVIPLKMTPN